MRAAVIENPGDPLVVTEICDPSPAAGELVLRVHSAGICGTDLHLSAPPVSLPPGTVLGHEFAGEVVAVGPGVEGWRVGDRACALPFISCGSCIVCLAGDGFACPHVRTIGQGNLPGAHAELVRVGAKEAFQLPESLDYEAGALVEPLAVGLHALRTAALEPGDDVLVLGAGPIGLAAAVWARYLGAAEVVVADRLPARLALARAFGATSTVNATDDPTLAGVSDTCDGPPDVVIECVGSVGML